MQRFLEKTIGEKPNNLITYEEYMQYVLYHPSLGYYMKRGEKVGKKGDFITTSNISDIYGRIIAKWLLRLTKDHHLGPAVCEIGAGNGRFAAAFLDEWKRISQAPLDYYLLEESPFHRELQEKSMTLNNHGKQITKLEEIKPFKGLIFSNELYDALPVRVIEKQHGRLMEAMIAVEKDHLVEKFVPLEDEKVVDYLSKSKLYLNDGQRIEIPLVMEAMVSKIADVLEVGMVLTVDYGYSNEEWGDPIHRQGSLRGYYRHEMMKNILLHPGEMDITSHIHLDSFIRYGEEQGLDLVTKKRLDEFLLSIGILEELQDHDDPNPFSEVSRRNSAIRSLILPTGISSYFNAIVQQKGITLSHLNGQ